MAVAAQVGPGDEHGQSSGQPGLDLAAVLAHLRLDERQAEEAVGLGLGRRTFEARPPRRPPTPARRLAPSLR